MAGKTHRNHEHGGSPKSHGGGGGSEHESATSSSAEQDLPLGGQQDLTGNAHAAETNLPKVNTSGSEQGKQDPWSAMTDAFTGSGMGIPFLEEMEAAFGEDFSGVKAVVGGGALGDAGANAATDGETISFQDPSPDKRTVAEELAHVVQMRSAAAGAKGSDVISRPGDAAEQEAGRAADAVALGQKAPTLTARPTAGIHRNNASSQRWPPGFSPVAKARQIRRAVQGIGTDERAVKNALYTGRQDMTQAISSTYQRLYGERLYDRICSEMSGSDERDCLRLLRNGRYTLADKIERAVDGWGANEDAIFLALERAPASDLEEIGRRRDIMSRLRSELNRTDWNLALAYIRGQGQLAAKLRRAASGWGTDEDAIWRAIEAAPQTERDFVRGQTWARNRLRSELNDSDYARAIRMLEGRLTNLDRIEIAVSGWGTEETNLTSAISNLNQSEFDTMRSGSGKYIRSISHLNRILSSELSGQALLEAQRVFHQKRLEYDGGYRQAWEQQNQNRFGEEAMASAGAGALVAGEGQTMSAVGRIKVACKGAGTDDEDLWDAIADMSDAERRFVMEHNPEGVLQTMESDLSSSHYARAMRALRGGAGGAIAVLEAAVVGAGTNERALYDMVDRIISEGSGAQVLAHTAIMRHIQGDVSGTQYSVFRQALTSGQFTPLMRLRWATAMAGTDEDLCWELCRTHGSTWYTGGRVDPTVDAILQSELSTRDYWTALDHIRGEPQTHEEKLARAEEELERERGGMSTAIMDSMSSSGENADQAYRDYQSTYNQAYEDQQISQEEEQSLDRDRQTSLRMTAEYRAAKESVAQWATNIAIAIVGIAATILTGGGAGPFVVALAAKLGGTASIAAQAMVLGAALKVGINEAILGEGYDATGSQGFIDAVSGSIEVGLMMVGNIAAQRAVQGLTGTTSAVGPGVQQAFGGAGRRIMTSGLEGSIDGTIGGIGEGMFLALAQEETWQGEMEDFFGNIATTTALTTGMSAGGGFIGGAGLRSIGETFGPMVRGRMSGTSGADNTLTGSSDGIMARNAGTLSNNADDQAQLFQDAVATNQRMQGISDDITNDMGVDRSLQGIKGNRPGTPAGELSQEGFIGGVLEKNARKNYDSVGKMTDMSRGRLEFDGAGQADAAAMRLKQRLTDEFGADNIDYTGPRGDYKRHHILVRDPATGIWHEFQVGPKAITEFIEGMDVRLPAGVQLHAAPNFHTVKYDVLDNLRKADVRERLGLPDDIAARVGLDELDPKYNQLFRESGQTTADKALPDNFHARQQELADEMATILERLETHQPGLTQRLDLKLKATDAGDAATGALTKADSVELSSTARKADELTPNKPVAKSTRRAAGKEAEADFLGGKTSNSKRDAIMDRLGLDPDDKLPGFNTVPEEWLPRYVEVVTGANGKTTRKFNEGLSDVWGTVSGKQDHAALAADRVIQDLNARMNAGELPSGKYAWNQYGDTPAEAMASLDRLSDVYRLMDNKVVKGNPTARARAEVFQAIRQWIEVSEGRVVNNYFEALDTWARTVPDEMDRTVAMIQGAKAGVDAAPPRPLGMEDLSPWRDRLKALGIDADRLSDPGVTGGRVKRADWFDGKAPTTEELASVRTASDASDSMTLADQMASVESGKSRTAREVLIAAEQGSIPRYVARVGNYADSFTNRASGDVYAADIADLRGMVGKPDEAMRTVGWETEWIEAARAKGRSVYITVIDTQAVGWQTSQIDWAGIQSTASFDIIDKSSKFYAEAATHGIKPDDLPGLLKQLAEVPPGATPPPQLEPIAEALDKAYGLNNLYSGGGFTVTDKTISGRTGNVGAREVKVSSGAFELDPAGKGVWWDSIELGTLQQKTTPGSS